MMSPMRDYRLLGAGVIAYPLVELVQFLHKLPVLTTHLNRKYYEYALQLKFYLSKSTLVTGFDLTTPFHLPAEHRLLFRHWRFGIEVFRSNVSCLLFVRFF